MNGRKILLSVIVLVWAGLWVVSAETPANPDLRGNWTGTSVGHYAKDGYISQGTYNYTLAITDQKDRIFNGTLFETGSGGEKTYGFSGVISADMKTLNMADHDSGYNIGYLVAPDSMELILQVDGTEGLTELCTLVKG